MSYRLFSEPISNHRCPMRLPTRRVFKFGIVKSFSPTSSMRIVRTCCSRHNYVLDTVARDELVLMWFSTPIFTLLQFPRPRPNNVLKLKVLISDPIFCQSPIFQDFHRYYYCTCVVKNRTDIGAYSIRTISITIIRVQNFETLGF